MRIQINSKHKSIPGGISFNLPKFCILTGKNGSGKSHLLEVIADTGKSHVFIEESQTHQIIHIGVNNLTPTIDELCDDTQIRAHINNIWNQINSHIHNFRSNHSQETDYTKIRNTYLIPTHGNQKHIYDVTEKIIQKSGKNFQDLTESDVIDHIKHTEIIQNGLFNSQFALIFKAYQKRKFDNEVNEFLSINKGENDIKYLTNEDFSKKYGPPPWELVNEILEKANLPYKVIEPKAKNRDFPYKFSLTDTKNGIEISANDLSSGEKVLMSLALAIYNTREGSSKPDLLLLDEPDAPLHPQFSKLFIDTLCQTIVEKAGVNVIITTHSPSTVAMAPDNTVFEVSRETKIPNPVSNNSAIEILTSGLDFLKIKNENRKQIFVESKYDVLFYQKFYQILSRRNKYIYTPIFLEPHSGTSNCHDVKSIVKKLRESGSDLAHGLIDYDLANSTEEFITVLGDGNRYSIENYILDPILVALALIRSGKMNFQDFGVANKTTYIDSQNLTMEECQSLANSILARCAINFDEIIYIELENNFTIQYPKSFTHHQGHDFEIKIKEKIPEVNAVFKGQGDEKLKMAILEIAAENPHLISKDLGVTFEKLLNPEK